MVASFPGSTNYTIASSSPLTFTIGRATPQIAVSDSGGMYTGSSYQATTTMTGVSGPAASSLEGVTPTLVYYLGSSATGASSSTAPSTAGNYTVVASFAGSTDYNSANSLPVTFTISQVTPQVSVSDSGGIYS